MTTENVGNLSHSLTGDDRPSGIPRRGQLGVAKSELVSALLALAALVLLACAFYFTAR
jgi:hypothetical protein